MYKTSGSKITKTTFEIMSQDCKSQMDGNVTGGFTVPAVKFMEPIGIGNFSINLVKKAFSKL